MIEDHELDINGYVCVRKDSESGRTGGVLLYIRKEIKYEVILVESCERNWWAIMVKIIDASFRGVIMLIYHSPSGSDANFVEYLDESCDRTLMSDSIVVI